MFQSLSDLLQGNFCVFCWWLDPIYGEVKEKAIIFLIHLLASRLIWNLKMVLDDSRSWLLKKCVTCIILQGNSYLIRFQDGTKFSLVTGKWHLSATQPRKHRRFGRVEVSSVQFSALLLWLSDVSVDYSHFQFISLHLLLPRRVQHLPLDSPSPKFLLAVISFKIQL